MRRRSPSPAAGEAKAAPKRRVSSRAAAGSPARASSPGRARVPSPGPEGRASIAELSENKRRILFKFQKIDMNRDGILDTSEVAEILQGLDETVWTSERLTELMVCIDANRDGRIHFSEFVDWLFSEDKSVATDMFMSALEELPACAFDSKDYEFWKVVCPRRANVRREATISSEKVGSKENGTFVVGRREGEWLSLSGELGFMLIETDKTVMLERMAHPSSHGAAEVGDKPVPPEEAALPIPDAALAIPEDDRESVCSRLARVRWVAHDHDLFMHGMAYLGPMTAPKITWECEKAPREDHSLGAPDWLTATEFSDPPEVLHAKCRQLANLMRLSKHTALYTGAGISSAVIGQAALSGEETVGWKKDLTKAEPTFTHHALSFLGQRGLIHGWVQQNHDGLPQKAGFPQECINEIHGSWYDPSNPVVKYGGILHPRTYPLMVQTAETADLVLVLGTSLSGLNADQVALNAAHRSIDGEVSHPEGALGTVLINLQQTRHDGKMALRLFAKSDRVLQLLLQELDCGLPSLARPKWPTESRVLVPYGNDGKRVPEGGRRMWWDLSDSEEVKLLDHNCQKAGQPKYMHIGREPYGETRGSYTNGPGIGWVKERDESKFCFRIIVEGVAMQLGIWWLDVAMRGAVDILPVVNTEPLYEDDK